MAKRLTGQAMERIPYGAHVLVRNNEVRLATPDVANALAKDEPYWKGRGETAYAQGRWVTAEALEGLGQRDLKAIANGPIMDPISLYLPAGKLSEAEYQERLDLQFREAGIERAP